MLTLWVLLGSYEQEEDFGGFQLHKDIFLGMFDTYNKAQNARDKLFEQTAGYNDIVIREFEIDKLISETGVDWYS